jgi:hypothetical protein
MSPLRSGAAVQSDVVTYPSKNTEDFDEHEYEYLRKRYLEKRVDTNVELPHSGMRLRRQTKRAAIECNSPGYRALRKEIECLERQKNSQEIYRLLKQLAQWETTQGHFPTIRGIENGDNNDVVEVIDLSNED